MRTKSPRVVVTGKTYEVKELLKSECGAKWDAANRVWTVPAKFAELAQGIVASGQKSSAPVEASYAEDVSTSAVNWSDEQQAIFEWFATGSGNLVVQARAGTGKTTTIKQAFSHAPEAGPLLYAVFNAKNAREASAKITDSRVEVKTLHSLGFSFIKRVWSNAKPDDNVEFSRVESVAQLPAEVVTTVVKLVGFCKNLCAGIPSPELVVELIDSRSLTVADEFEAAFPPAKLAALAIEVLKLSLEQDTLGRISFNDMVWLPIAAGWAKPTYSLVVIDEAQDMNLPQLLMASRACLPSGRICVVGDDRQAIYGFRGAVSDGMRMMRDRLNAQTLGLTTTYRCPKSVVALAKEIVPDYTAADAAPEGEVVEMALDAAVAGLVVGDAVLSRLNAPLMGIAMSLLRRNIPARIEGRDIGKQLCAVVTKLRAKSIPDFLAKLTTWTDKQVKRALAGNAKYAESKVAGLQDQALTLTTVAEVSSSVDDLLARITSLFQDSDRSARPAVVCSSVHKAKGLEWGKVCLVASTFKSGASHEEANIYYVAITRAKQTLVRGL